MPQRDEISPLHPALAGHFPGKPIVPGVVILRRVCRMVTETHGGAVMAVPVVKFHAALKPAEPFDIDLEPARSGRISFRVLRGEMLIAAGTVLVGAAPDEDQGLETRALSHR
jgi:3-hydroxymyristoyl/3-hydroxydecanoyl-(acyl carrier protein) dehydratase